MTLRNSSSGVRKRTQRKKYFFFCVLLDDLLDSHGVIIVRVLASIEKEKQICKRLLSHMKHVLESSSMFHMTSEMRLAATDATDRSSIPFCRRFFPQEIYFIYFLTDDRDRGLPNLNIPPYFKCCLIATFNRSRT